MQYADDDCICAIAINKTWKLHNQYKIKQIRKLKILPVHVPE